MESMEVIGFIERFETYLKLAVTIIATTSFVCNIIIFIIGGEGAGAAKRRAINILIATIIIVTLTATIEFIRRYYL